MKQSFNQLFVLCLAFCSFVVNATSQNPISAKYTFSSFNIDNGLPTNFIDDIYKDSKGFMWVATQGGGLCRFDGYEFFNFNVSSDFIRLKSNFIRKVCEDKFSRLWVASDYGLDIINLRTMLKDDFGKENSQLKHIKQTPYSTIFLDSTGNLWLLSTSSVCKIVFTVDGNIARIVETHNQGNFTAIGEINRRVIVGENGSVKYITEDKKKILISSMLSPNLALKQGLFISSFLEDKNLLWLGTSNGLYKYDQSNRQIDRYSYDSNNPNSISQDMITSLAKMPDDILVVGTLKGLNFFNTKTGNIERICHGNNSSLLNSDFINCLLSNGNNLWVGTEAGGINKLSQRRLAIHNYVHDATSGSISPNPVNAILEDHLGNLWVGTVEGGLNLKMKGKTDFTHIKSGQGSITHNAVSALEEDRNGFLWIGTWGGGISRLDLNKLPQRIFSYLPPDIDYIAVLKYDQLNHGVWIGTNRQIFFYDIQSNSIHKPLDNKLTQNILGTLGCIIDKQDKLWIGTSNGLMLIDLNTLDRKTFRCKARLLKLPEEEVNKLFFKNITGILQSKDNTVWLSSNGYGICCLQEKDGKYHGKTFTKNDGLVNNSCISLLESDNGLIWIGTGNGISCLNPESRQFVNYSKSDGLNDVQFYWNAGYKSKVSNKIYFGSMSGLTEIDGNIKDGNKTARKVTFTKLQVLNKTVNSTKEFFAKEDIAYAKKIELHESDKSFVIEFSAMDYNNPSAVNYSYRMLGFDDKWISAPADRRFVSYTNLGAGTYRLQVRCSNSSGEWSNEISELVIIVHPYFYKTYWFIGLVVLLIAGIIVQFYRWRMSELKRQKNILHRKVEERTGELAQQTVVLEKQALELKDRNNKLLEQNDKIRQQRKQLIQMSEKVQEALNDRISFFTNITHEFRTPITLIIGPIERALKLSTNPKVIEQLKFVSHNSRNLLSLVNQLMDFRKVESDSIRINPKLGNLIDFLDENLLPFESFARERNIQIRKFFHVGEALITFDNEAYRKLISNLLSNAIKYTQDYGTVALYVASWTNNKNEKKIYICVKDNGVGIDEAELQTIFDRFYQSKQHTKYPIYGQSGTGIGLYLCRKIVELMGGEIYAKNNIRKGASFRVILPLNENAKIETEKITTVEAFSIPTENISEQVNQTEKLSVLLVEDNKEMRQYMKSVLEERYFITEAENGQQALTILKSKIIDFIISDLMMPVMDGLELSKKVKADFSISHIPFLMLTAKTGKATQIDSYQMGVDEILFKPFDEDILLARIENILKTRRNYQAQFSRNMKIEQLNMVKESSDEKFIQKLIQIIQENYKNPDYDATNFIQSIGISKTLVHNKMQTLIDQTPGNFLRSFRLNKAREMLLEKDNELTISEIAYEVGFNDPKYFTRCFTKQYGVNPSSFAKESNEDFRDTEK